MSLDDEIRRKQAILRQQMDEAKRQELLQKAWRDFCTNSPFTQNSPIVENTPSELQGVLFELMSNIKYKNPKLIMKAPDQTIRAAVPNNNGHSNKKSFDITLMSTGSGKDLNSLGIWVFSVDRIAFVRDNCLSASWSELKSNGITPSVVRDKAIETIAMQNMHKDGGCYIATSVYGSYDCPEVWVLRRYRDYRLMKSIFGRLFVKVYYLLSPSLVRKYSQKSWFKRFWVSCLNRKIQKLKKKGYSDDPYYD